MATIVWDAAPPQVHRPRRPPARCPSPATARAAARAVARCRSRNRRVAGVGVGVAVAGALALGLVPGGAGAAGEPVAPVRPVAATSPAPGADAQAGGTYEVIDRALAGTGDVTRLVAGLEGAAGE
jgi:hypothetical protein